jgi:hypothetical protein
MKHKDKIIGAILPNNNKQPTNNQPSERDAKAGAEDPDRVKKNWNWNNQYGNNYDNRYPNNYNNPNALYNPNNWNNYVNGNNQFGPIPYGNQYGYNQFGYNNYGNNQYGYNQYGNNPYGNGQYGNLNDPNFRPNSGYYNARLCGYIYFLLKISDDYFLLFKHDWSFLILN